MYNKIHVAWILVYIFEDVNNYVKMYLLIVFNDCKWVYLQCGIWKIVFITESIINHKYFQNIFSCIFGYIYYQDKAHNI